MNNLSKIKNLFPFWKIMGIIEALIIVVMLSVFVAASAPKRPKTSHQMLDMNFMAVNKEARADTLTEWEIMILAIIGVESEYNAKITRGRIKGYLQITPIYVKDVNNITNNIYAFSIDDAINPYHSFKMFEIMNKEHNTEKDIDKAIRIHNPGGGKIYMAKVKKRMKMIKDYEKARKALIKSSSDGRD